MIMNSVWNNWYCNCTAKYIHWLLRNSSWHLSSHLNHDFSLPQFEPEYLAWQAVQIWNTKLVVLKTQSTKEFVKPSVKFQTSRRYDCNSSAIKVFPKGSQFSQCGTWKFLVILGSYSVSTRKKVQVWTMNLDESIKL